MQTRYFYEFGSFRFVPSEHMLIQDGSKEIKLQPRASEVLQVLLENRDRMLTRREITTKVWGVVISIGEGSLDYQIHILRRALDDDPANPKYIETKKRRGIKFIASVKVVCENTAEPPVTDEEQQASPLPSPRTRPTSRWTPSRRVLTVSAVVVAGLVTAAVYFGGSSPVRPSVTVNSDDSWKVIVPVVEEGVKLETHGRRFEVSEGDTIEVISVGSVDIGRGLVSPDGEVGYGDNSMDSIFKDHVGGLEMWIGPDKNANRYFVGSGFEGKVNHSGIPTFRVIESIHGYHDGNNSGFFQVAIRKVVGNQ